MNNPEKVSKENSSPTTESPARSYRIADLAKAYDITPRTIRFYEDQGMLAPLRKGRQRIFHERDHVRLRLILRGKRLGFSLAEVREIIDLYDVDAGGEKQLVHLLSKIDQRRISLEQQMKDIQDTLNDLKGVEKRVRKALKELREK
ncbi:MAG: MerR family DNA-binding transcriptional regulator [Gammaproteobacteria bacterium]|nr:MerR family DNA-binding transcriptional regulator [Gammaproteobacteria bacterium]